MAGLVVPGPLKGSRLSCLSRSAGVNAGIRHHDCKGPGGVSARMWAGRQPRRPDLQARYRLFTLRRGSAALCQPVALSPRRPCDSPVIYLPTPPTRHGRSGWCATMCS
jgi:hypothetical protein